MAIYCFDFSSLFPSMMLGGNLYSPANTQNGDKYWQGSGIYTSKYQNERDGIKGKYLTKRGTVENIIFDLVNMKNKSKDEPSKRLACKILVNTCYGVLGSPKFKSVHSITAASDVTAMARRSILHASTVLEDYGYVILYNDTDSAFVKDPYNDLPRLQAVINYIVSEQKKSMNIPHDLHDFKLESIIKRMYFFRDDKGEFIKKHYIYVKDDDSVVTKGLMVVKGNCSKFSKEFYDTVIKTKIIKNKYKPYEPKQLLKELKLFSKGREQLLQKRYRVKELSAYKIPEGKDEPTTINYQISKKYGVGEHWLVANKRIGVGKGNKWTTIDELKSKYGKYWVDQVCFEIYMMELKAFIDWKQRNQIHKTDRKRIK